MRCETSLLRHSGKWERLNCEMLNWLNPGKKIGMLLAHNRSANDELFRNGLEKPLCTQTPDTNHRNNRTDNHNQVAGLRTSAKSSGCNNREPLEFLRLRHISIVAIRRFGRLLLVSCVHHRGRRRRRGLSSKLRIG